MEPAGVPPVGGDQLAPPGFQTPEQIAQGLTTNAQNPQPGVSRPVGAESQPPGRRQPSLVPGLPNPLPLFTNLLPGPSRPPQLQQPHVQPPFDMPPLHGAARLQRSSNPAARAQRCGHRTHQHRYAMVRRTGDDHALAGTTPSAGVYAGEHNRADHPDPRDGSVHDRHLGGHKGG